MNKHPTLSDRLHVRNMLASLHCMLAADEVLPGKRASLCCKMCLCYKLLDGNKLVGLLFAHNWSV